VNSIINGTENGVCFFCGRVCHTHKHHIFGAYNRKRSDKDGLFVYLCPECHMKLHDRPKFELYVRLKEIGQIAWMREYQKTKDDFIKEYGKNFIDYWRGKDDTE
jgi:hypothetical protein